MYLSNSDIEILRLAGWCKNLPADIWDSFGSQVFESRSIKLLELLGLLNTSKNGKCIRLRDKGSRFLDDIGFQYHRDSVYKSNYDRRIEVSRILLTFYRAGCDVFASSIKDLEAAQIFMPSMVARRDSTSMGDLLGGASFWGIARIMDYLATCFYITNHEENLINIRNEKYLLSKLATIVNRKKAMIFAGIQYEKLARALRNNKTAYPSEKVAKYTFSQIYQTASFPIYLLECSDAGAFQLLIMAQENYRKKLARVIFGVESSPPIGITDADGSISAPDNSVTPWVLAIDMDICRIDRAYRQTKTAGYDYLLIICLPKQDKALEILYGDKKTKIVVLTEDNIKDAFGKLSLYEPCSAPYIAQQGGFIDAANLPTN